MTQHFYAYRFADTTRTYNYVNIAHRLLLAGETYEPISIQHTAPTFSSDPTQARTVITLRHDLSLPINYISHPPPWQTELRVYEVLATSALSNVLTAIEYNEHWTGQLTHVKWLDSFRSAQLLCKTLQEIHFSRETLNEGLNPLCRFHLGDGRCPINIENFKEVVTVTDVSDDISEPTVEVAGLAQVNSYYKAGMIRTADRDWRSVEKAATSGANKLLTLNRAFPSTSLQIGDTVEVFAGDDLTLETCATVFGAETNSGESWGGWKLTPNQDFGATGIHI